MRKDRNKNSKLKEEIYLYVIPKTLQLLCFCCLLYFDCNMPVDLSNWNEIPKSDFFKKQLEFPRVRDAFEQKERILKELLTEHNIHSFDIDLYLRAFKQEKKLEVWGKSKAEEKYKLIQDYNFCVSSGTLGPKRKEGDFQIPEGFYHLSHFNPKSNFLLSLKINYPNTSDKILSDPSKPGSDIYIHGGCQTVGCIPITNDKIQILYLLTVLAKEPEKTIPVHIFPFRMIEPNMNENLIEFPEHEHFWKSLKEGFEYFEEEKKLFEFNVLLTGEYEVRQ